MPHPKHPAKSLHEHFSSLIDPRIERHKGHLLGDLLIISILAMLCDAQYFTEFEAFGKAKEAWLRTFLQLPGGIPSHDTFRRVFSLLDPEHFCACFRNWTQSLRRAVAQEIVALDGKTARGSHDRIRGRQAIHIVSAWARENGLVLGQIKVEEKSNEITAIPELLRVLELTGCIVTIDAMGAQKAIAAAVRNADADYVLALKGNHETLHAQVASFLVEARNRKFRKVKHEYLETLDEDHGRLETRRYWITGQIEWLEDRAKWEGLQSIGMVERIRDLGGEVTTELSFYLCSIAPKARLFARAARGHWSIENQLHWSLDVSFSEDQCRMRTGYGAENLNLLRHIALNTLKRDTTKKVGVKTKRKIAAWDHSYLLSLLDF
jgi:predicted transposase YbfD/YdcC